MERVVVIGAGGHGQVVADALLAAGIEVAGFLDDHPTRPRASTLDLPVLGGPAALSDHPHDAIVVAIGDNRGRAEMVGRIPVAEKFVRAIHPSAVVSRGAAVEPGVMLCAGVAINTGARIGAHAIINTGATVDHHCTVGAFVHVAPGAHLGGDVHVGEGSLVGIGSSVLPGVSVGRWATVGAGAVVVQDVPDHATVVGVPARVVAQGDAR